MSKKSKIILSHIKDLLEKIGIVLLIIAMLLLTIVIVSLG